ncbi:hypothetical protein [Demequina lignilytica]|uniref:Uncharacterized protein n=1 Tax=Demequina lignilytica TaxID=3051663 RepID=A0AB35ME62_9MICO|nr:hypothetical protein [Demequina sp. SYSU T0a273]MDN4482048.1 hypothetical protein [Demequina sp. SYSU T0a273]
MNPIAQKYGASALAGVNLIPTEIAERKKMRTVVTMSVIAVVIAIAAVALAFAVAFIARLAVEADRDNAAADEAAAVAARDGKAQVYYDVRSREQEEFTLAQIGFGEIDYAQLTASIQDTADDESAFDSIHVIGPDADGIVDSSDDGSAYGAGIGSLTFIARADSVDAANALLVRLENVPGVANVRGVTEAVGSDGAETYWSVEGTAVLTDLLLTNRLIPAEGISGVAGVLAPIVEPSAEPSATPAPSPTATEEG